MCGCVELEKCAWYTRVIWLIQLSLTHRFLCFWVALKLTSFCLAVFDEEKIVWMCVKFTDIITGESGEQNCPDIKTKVHAVYGMWMKSQTKTYLLLAVWHSCSVQYPSHFPPHTSKCQHRYPDVNVLPAFDDVTPMKWHRAAASSNSRKKWERTGKASR